MGLLFTEPVGRAPCLRKAGLKCIQISCFVDKQGPGQREGQLSTILDGHCHR